MSLALFPQVAPKFLAVRDGKAPAAAASPANTAADGVRELYVEDLSIK